MGLYRKLNYIRIKRLLSLSVANLQQLFQHDVQQSLHKANISCRGTDELKF